MRPGIVFYMKTTVIIVAVFWIFMIYGMWCTNKDIKDQDEPCPTMMPSKIQLESKELQRMNQAIQHKARELQHLETTLKRRYPNDVENILALHRDSNNVPCIYAITPTYARLVQKAELTRLSQTFLHVPNFHWIVIEDSEDKTELVTNLLTSSGVRFTHLNEPTPKDYKLHENEPNWFKPRGVLQRNEGLRWLRHALDPDTDQGVVYFADDDNVYDLKVFEEMRSTVKVSVWPVALVGKMLYESPVLENDKVVGWHTYWYPQRPFAMDMAGFAINLNLILTHLEAEFKIDSKRGYMESDLLEQLKLTKDDLEAKADSCTKILVWHTRTEVPNTKNEKKLFDLGRPTSSPLIEL